MKVAIRIDKTVALLAGHDRHGWHMVDVPAESLSPEQRETLAGCNSTWGGQTREADQADYRLAGDELSPICTVPTADVVRSCLDAILANQLAEQTKAAEAAKVAKEKLEAEIAAADAQPDESYVTEAEYDTFRDFATDTTTRKAKSSLPWLGGALDDKRGRVAKMVVAENSRRGALHAGKVREIMANRKTLADARRLQVASWVRDHGTSSQQARHEEGLLAESEVVDGIRDAAFAPLGSVERYVKIKHSDVCECGGEGCAISCTVDDAEHLAEEQYDRLLEIRRLLPDATVTARVHVCTSSCEETETRLSALVELGVGTLDLSREYSL